MRNKFILIILLILFFANLGFCQYLNIQWQKCLGGTYDDAGISIVKTADGNYILGADVVSNDGDVSGNHGNHFDFWVTKIDGTGNILWQKCFGGTAEDRLSSLGLTNDGFIACGTTGSNDGDVLNQHGSGDYWVVKGDDVGSVIWKKCFGGSELDEAHNIILNSNLGYLCIGSSVSSDFDVTGRHDSALCPVCPDVWLTKIDTTGNLQWAKCYGSSFSEFGYSIVQSIDSGFVFAATSDYNDGDVSGVHDQDDFWIVKVDSVGVIQWQKSFGGTQIEIPYNIINTNDGGYCVIGYTESTDFDVVGHHGSSMVINEDVWVIKLDGAGNLQWQKCLGGSDGDAGKKIIQLYDGSYLALCLTTSTDEDLSSNPASGIDSWLVKLDPLGNIQWQQIFGGSYDDALYDIQQTSDSGFIFVGVSNSIDSGISGNHGGYDVWLVKTGTLSDEIKNNSNSINDFSAFLNAYDCTLSISYYANGNENVQLVLRDVTGRLLFQDEPQVNVGFNHQKIQIGSLSSGIYLLNLTTFNGTVTKKLIMN